MYPELFSIWGFPINTYGLMLALSFVGGLWIAGKLAEEQGFDKTKIYDLGLYMLIAQLIGSKLLLIVVEWSTFSAEPRLLLSMQFIRSGGVFYGGFLAALGTSFFLAYRSKIPWWTLADICAPGIAFGQFTGRLGCFSAGCCWGKPTDSWIGVEFTELAHRNTGVPIHVHLYPVQLFESIAMFLVMWGLLFIMRHRKFYGQVILSYLAIYAIERFSIEFFRDDPRGSLLGLSTSQLIAGCIAPIAIGIFIIRWRQSRNNKLSGSEPISNPA